MRCLLIAAAGDYLGVRIRCEKAAFNMAALAYYFILAYSIWVFPAWG